jgi:hypothetical protein
LSPAGDILASHVATGPCAPDGTCSHGFGPSPAIGKDGTIYVARPGLEVLALSPSGTVVWSQIVPSAPSTALTILADGTLVGGTTAGHVVAFSSSGTLVFDTAVSSLPVTEVFVSGSKLIAVAPGEMGAVIGLSSAGQISWTREVGGLVDAIALPGIQPPFPMSDGTVFALSGDPVPQFSYVIENAGGMIVMPLESAPGAPIGPLADGGGGIYWADTLVGPPGTGNVFRLGLGTPIAGYAGTDLSPMAMDAKGRLVFANGPNVLFIGP